MQSVSEFYDSLAPDYDRMTDFKKRFEKEQPAFRELVTKFNIRSALDAGCGTGFHSFLLASLGVDVTAVDVSKGMVELLRQHASELGIHVNSVQAGFEELPDVVHDTFDAVFCLGNTLAHLLTRDALRVTLKNFKSMLREKGTLVIQVLNYERILSARERIQNVKEREGNIYIRFYDFLDELIAFNILTLKRNNTNISPTLQTTTLRPVLRAEMEELLKEAGFQEIIYYGTLALTPYDERASNDMILCAR